MKHPFLVLKPEYERLLATVQVTRTQVAIESARRLLTAKARYRAVADKSGVPALMLMALHNRESNANFNTYLGNGQRLDRVTTWVPKGRGPWHPPDAWEKGAFDAIIYDKLNDNSAPWSMPYACWKGEAWNGFGPRNHGIHTGYLWAGTNHYTRGKYVSDGVWDRNHVDIQLGMIPLMMTLAKMEPSLAISGPVWIEVAPSIVPPLPTPVGVGDGIMQTKWVQNAINTLGRQPPLLVDGSYGRRTREAVRAWQTAHNVKPFDGLAGPITLAALERALKKIGANNARND